MRLQFIFLHRMCLTSGFSRVETTTLIANIIINTEVACVDFFFTYFLDFFAEEFSMFHLHLFAYIASSIAGAGGDR